MLNNSHGPIGDSEITNCMYTSTDDRLYCEKKLRNNLEQSKLANPVTRMPIMKPMMKMVNNTRAAGPMKSNPNYTDCERLFDPNYRFEGIP